MSPAAVGTTTILTLWCLAFGGKRLVMPPFDHSIKISGPGRLDELYQTVLGLALGGTLGLLIYFGRLVIRLEYEGESNENTHRAGHYGNPWNSYLHAMLFFPE
jgi:hypothetical protein